MNRIIIENLIIVYVVREFLAFLGTREHVIVFTKACHWILF